MALDFPSSPTTGQTYTGSDGTQWKWDGAKWVSGQQSLTLPKAAVARVSAGNYDGFTNTTGVMAGMSAGVSSITPVLTGRLLVIMTVSCMGAAGAAPVTAFVSTNYDLGAGPVRGHSPTGNQVAGSFGVFTGAISENISITTSGIITGLTLGQSIWVDGFFSTPTAGQTINFGNMGINMVEI